MATKEMKTREVVIICDIFWKYFPVMPPPKMSFQSLRYSSSIDFLGFFREFIMGFQMNFTKHFQQAFTCSKSTIKILEKGVKCFQSLQ